MVLSGKWDVQVVTLLVGGSMALSGQVTPEQLTTFVLYVEFVTAASLSVCDQWGPLMEAIGASERVMFYLDKPSAPQIAAGQTLPSWSGKVQLNNMQGIQPVHLCAHTPHPSAHMSFPWHSFAPWMADDLGMRRVMQRP